MATRGSRGRSQTTKGDFIQCCVSVSRAHLSDSWGAVLWRNRELSVECRTAASADSSGRIAYNSVRPSTYKLSSNASEFSIEYRLILIRVCDPLNFLFLANCRLQVGVDRGRGHERRSLQNDYQNAG